MSLAIMTLLAATIGTMALAVQTATTFTRGQSNAAQHGRVVLDRLDRTLVKAIVSESFPGFMVVTWPDGSGTFPDTLVIWSRLSTARPAGFQVTRTSLPWISELTIIRPDPSNPGTLLEITNPSEPSTTPTYASSDLTNWRTVVAMLTGHSSAVKVELTNLLRTAATSTSPNASQRGCVRFRYSAAPSDTELSNYRAGTSAWTSLPWPQDVAGKTMGLRSLGCFTELQLVPTANDTEVGDALPFFGSTLIWKEVQR